ncbi:glycosyltransferase family 4 protein [Pseudodesulfovibrio sediminis]|uniref:Glycosyl transferase family 1 n=1 Tax=Pseudodesulfovibrio sediminis TaxID=2810563 RepID=A0ABN6EU67_9BACT|nr:glycosyltransferase family 4 protein [Pseudodesulfovibrio sediminis]BCS89040.1 glycosyl transferase family 1 [Pseudodesulfovibrio sediminis]
MKIGLCTPFKPVDHPSISGDVTIARDLVSSVRDLGHEVVPLPYFPAKEIYRNKAKWLEAQHAMVKMARVAGQTDCWLTYGSYYKVPDIFGLALTHRLKLPYFILQASYAENRGRKIATWPGFRLNKRAMLQADHIFCNRRNDMRGCAKLLPEERYTFIPPGVPEGLLKRDEQAGNAFREAWGVGDSLVVETVAIMRAGVKAVGVQWMFHTCAELIEKGRDITLIVAGDGPLRGQLEAEGKALLGDRVRFVGLVPRNELGGFFSAGDLFAFPGLKESIGMLYLEAQMCGLPVVATDDEGAPMVVRHEQGGLLTRATEHEFTRGVDRLITDASLRRTLGSQAMQYVLDNHSSIESYRVMTGIMESIVNKGQPS